MSATEPPTRAVFQMSRLAILAVLVSAGCALPFATGGPWLWLVYLLPLGLIAWILRRRTVVDGAAVTTRTVLRTRRVPWSDISSLRLGRNARVSVVLTDGAELPLPAVYVRDLPALAAVSGGRLPDPTGG